jgi:hypothetical protein
MNLHLRRLQVRTRRTVEEVDLSHAVTFLYGPISVGKSSIARLVDYCLGGDLERTPAIRAEFLAAVLHLQVGRYAVELERSAGDSSWVRATWSAGPDDQGAANAPLSSGESPIHLKDVYCLSDLLFWLAGVQPIKVRRSKLDPDSPLVRLSFRDLMRYCYLEQHELDSSFYRMEDAMRRLKSRDAMRFVTGLYSDRMNDLEGKLAGAIDTQRGKREAVAKIREFMAQFDLGSELEHSTAVQKLREELHQAEAKRGALDQNQGAATHASEPLREKLRELSKRLAALTEAIEDLEGRIAKLSSLRSELITAKVKAQRAETASAVLEGVDFEECPRCGASLESRSRSAPDTCCLCGSPSKQDASRNPQSLALAESDLNSRIDDLAETISRHQRNLDRERRSRDALSAERATLDARLAEELARYDTAFISNAREVERDIATLREKLASFEKLAQFPRAIDNLEREAASLQVDIDSLKTALADERRSFAEADKRVRAIGDAFRTVLSEVKFPGVVDSDTVELDSRDWLPWVHHGDIQWSFADAGSGGKKTLFNVCYALAVHRVARKQGLKLPTFLIVDSPTKNISKDLNQELVRLLYAQIYRLASEYPDLQLLLIDSDLVRPDLQGVDFTSRKLDTSEEPGVTPLISYYRGP